MSSPSGTLQRRDFLKLSIGGTASLALLASGVELSGCSQQTARAADGYQWLTDADLAFARALIAGVAGITTTAGTEGVIEEALRRTDLCLNALAAPAQKQMRQLFDLIQWAPFRRFAAGVTRPWQEASAADAQILLAHFRDSRLSLLNGAHRALVKIGSTVYWSQAASYGQSHYPGPPAWVVAALEA